MIKEWPIRRGGSARAHRRLKEEDMSFIRLLVRRPTQLFGSGVMPKSGGGRRPVFPRHGGAAVGHGTRKTGGVGPLTAAMMLVVLACETPPSGPATEGRTKASDGYLSDQATGMAAEDADRARPATKRRPLVRQLQPLPRHRRSPVDQPRIR